VPSADPKHYEIENDDIKLYKFQISGYEESHSKTYMLGLGTIDDQNRFTGKLKHENFNIDLSLPTKYDAKSDPDITHAYAYGNYGGGAGSHTVHVSSLPITNITLANDKLSLPDYPGLSPADKKELTSFIETIKTNCPDAKIENITKLCTIASDLKDLTVKNMTGKLEDETFNRITDQKELDVKMILKDLPGVKERFDYEPRGAAIKLELPQQQSNSITGCYAVPEIPKVKLTLPANAVQTVKNENSKKRGYP
jgi:hypothetical protein